MDPALTMVEYADKVMFDGDALFSILQAIVDPTSNKSSVYYFCNGEWHEGKCFCH